MNSQKFTGSLLFSIECFHEELTKLNTSSKRIGLFLENQLMLLDTLVQLTFIDALFRLCLPQVPGVVLSELLSKPLGQRLSERLVVL